MERVRGAEGDGVVRQLRLRNQIPAQEMPVSLERRWILESLWCHRLDILGITELEYYFNSRNI